MGSDVIGSSIISSLREAFKVKDVRIVSAYLIKVQKIRPYPAPIRRLLFAAILQAGHVVKFLLRKNMTTVGGALLSRYPMHMQNEQSASVLTFGEWYCRRKFGANTVNQGAALFECEWDGGRFEAGLFMGGMFRSGQFVGGIFLGGTFWDGTWLDGTWEGGFDRNGIYRPRGDSPSPL